MKTHLQRKPPRHFQRLALGSIGRLGNNVFYLYVYLSEQAIQLRCSGKLIAIVSICPAICFSSNLSLRDLLLRPACYLCSCLAFFCILTTHCTAKSSYAASTRFFLQALTAGLSYSGGRFNTTGTTKATSITIQQTCRQTSLVQEAVHGSSPQCFYNSTDLPGSPFDSVSDVQKPKRHHPAPGTIALWVIR